MKSLRLWRLYEDAYSALYEWNLRMWRGDASMASWMTACGLTLSLCLYMGSVAGLLVIVYGPLPGSGKVASTIILSVAALTNYVPFIRRNRYQEVVKRFRARPGPERRRMAIVGWTFVLGSFLVMYGMIAAGMYLEERGKLGPR